MTDPQDVMLESARAIHDRSPDHPGHCAECRDETGARVPWPCWTAVTLGATGRSEWKTPGVDDKPRDTLRCDSRAPDRPLIRCALEDGHVEHSGRNHQDTGMNM